jgi:amino acid adenylation domain-containing protein
MINTASTPHTLTTLVELLRYRSLTQPAQVAYRFLADGETETDCWTYQYLDQRSRQIAAELQAMGFTGTRALLLYPPGLEFLAAFFGCLYAGVVAVPAYPPRNHRNTPRIQAIAQDAEASIVLTSMSALSKTRALLLEKTNLEGLQWLATDGVETDANSWQAPAINAETLAFLQYTSGSTGTPKGVMLSHGNLLHNAVTTYQYMEHSPDSVFVTWLPVYHDMGLIGGVLQPLYGGFPCVMMPPASFLQSPYRWLNAISNYRGTTSGGPNFAYDLCVQKITPQQRETLDLSCWKVAFNGAEPVRFETLEGFAKTFNSCGFQQSAFYPCYGMAEATLMVSGVEVSAVPVVQNVDSTALETHQVIQAQTGSSQTFVSCGTSIPQQKIVIVNPETLAQCQPHEVGEIWVSGPSIGHGYWNRPEDTKETFQAIVKDTQEGPFLRTGDLGFLQDQQLFITGRFKDLIIIRGRNLYPQDIELIAEKSHPCLRAGAGAAFAVEVANEEQLVIVQEVEFRQKPNVEEVTAAIRKAVSEAFEVQVYAVVLIKAGTISKTSSGKIQRRACKQRFLESQLEVIGSSLLAENANSETLIKLTSDELRSLSKSEQQVYLEGYLKALVSQLLQISLSQIDIQQSLMAFGLDSLKVFEFKNRIESVLNVSVSVTELFEEITLFQLIESLRNRLYSAPERLKICSIFIDSETQEHPLSDSQQGLWLIEQLSSNLPTYNIAINLQIEGNLNIEALLKSLNEMVSRHESLRTHFAVVNGVPVQRICSDVNLKVAIADLQMLSEIERSAEFQALTTEFVQQPFDLKTAPLFHAKLVHLTLKKHALLLSFHHIIVDGWSVRIFIEELSKLYQNFQQNQPTKLPPLPTQYTYFTHWQQQNLSPQIQPLLTYWKQKLSGKLPVLDLPTDFPRPRRQTFNGGHQSLQLSKPLTEAIKQLSRQQRTTLFMTLLAAFKTLLYRYTHQTDILVGSPIAHRNQAEIEGLIGFFVNVLVLRTNLSKEPSFQEFLTQVKQVTLEAYSHQDIPFKTLVEELQPQRDLSYNPLFQVMFAFQNLPLKLPKNTDTSFTCQELHTQTAKFDLTLFIEEKSEQFIATFEYNTDLFKPETITRMLGHWQCLLEGIIANPSQPVSHVPLLTESERNQLIFEFNQSPTFEIQQCFHQLFEAQVERTPDAIAVVFKNQQLTYRQLNQKANQLAHYLQKLGVEPEVIVGISIERSLEMLIGLLGILKAGAAYLPLDPTYPADRLSFMLKDAQVPVLLTKQNLKETLFQVLEISTHTKVVCLDSNGSEISQESLENPINQTTLNNLAYIIYTSGSTGKPKGTQIEHRGLSNYLMWCSQAYNVAKGEGSPVHSSISFDMTITGLFSPLIVGSKVELLPEEQGIESLTNALRNYNNYSLVKITPAQLELLTHQLSSQEVAGKTNAFIIGGENLVGETLEFWQKYAPETALVNEYGPTETVVGCCIYFVPKNQPQTGSVLIGRPIANTQLYILDQHLQPVPMGVIGELYIGGAGVARGYLNRPDLTCEKFISNPFLEDALLNKDGRVFNTGSSITTHLFNKPAPTNDSSVTSVTQSVATVTHPLPHSSRLYKTGDLARYLPDGNIEFLGRTDHQVKIRGFRIELGEIEAVLNQHENVKECIMISQQDVAKNQRLIAYIVPKDHETELGIYREFLKEQLPDYMIPNAFIQLEKLPLTVNGKVDRTALPAPDDQRPELLTNYLAPQTEIEQKIAEIWQETLQLQQVGIYDNFFDLGGHSLLMVQVHEKLQAAFNIKLSLIELFENSTIAALAKRLNQSDEKEPVLQGINHRVERQKNAIARRKMNAIKRGGIDS